MGITLGFLTSVLILLPGLVALVAFNLRSGRAGARRPEQPLTSVSAIVGALFVSVIAHLLAFGVVTGALDLAVAVHEALPTVDLGPTPPNPISSFYQAVANDRPMSTTGALFLVVVILMEVAAVTSFTTGDVFDLMLDRFDLGGSGWVFQHITRPAENGYAPIGHVFTTTMNEGYGVAYKGPIVDVRQGVSGEVLSITLARPERFLYEIGSFDRKPSQSWLPRFLAAREDDGAASATGFTLHDKDYVGGAVNLDGRIIGNIVVHSIARSLLDEIGGDDESAGETPA